MLESWLLDNIFPKDDPNTRKPDISLAKSNLNWSPVLDLETGLQKSINYFTYH